MTGVSASTIAGQVEKELEADVYINRNGQIMRATLRSGLYQGDKGILMEQRPEAACRLTAHLFGFCGGSHQQAAAKALENAWAIEGVPINAVLLRHITQAAEIMQNIPRWFYSNFSHDLTSEKYSHTLLYPAILERFAFIKGTSFRQGLMASAYPISLYSSIAGQWPQADFATPGGVSTSFQVQNLSQAFSILEKYRSEWLEPTWLGCSVERYLEIQSWQELMEWIEEKPAHRNSDLGLFIRGALSYGWDKLGGGVGRFLSYGIYGDLSLSSTQAWEAKCIAGGYYDGQNIEAINPLLIKEEMQRGNAHFQYKGQMVEVGPLARQVLACQDLHQKQAPSGLIWDILQEKGPSVFLRVLARMHESAFFFQKIQHWLSKLDLAENFNVDFSRYKQSMMGLGLTEAPRGALAHLTTTNSQKIEGYRILAPTLVNINNGTTPKAQSALAEALTGVIIEDPNKPVEVATIARSMDTCLNCKVNLYKHRSEKQIATVAL
ncbi:MAG: nickel-dependent hydrogenase large subunit [Saprospiraceae bacterium]|nr:nickel-dependent hydrogenase large subunit [Saprospiraceae bacterium]